MTRWASSILLAFFLSGTLHANTLTYRDIVRRLYDLTKLAEQPVAGEQSGSWTSTGRDAIYNAATGKYEYWGGGNGGNDGGDFVRREANGSIVAAEMTGPGVIWRVWSANPRNGHIKFYVDGASTPVLDMPFVEYFNNQKEPFNYPELTEVLSRGYNNYVPIPYRKSIKVVLEKDWGAFFQFSYTTFPQGVNIPSFKGRFDAAEKAALADVDRRFAQREIVSAPEAAVESVDRDLEIPPGKTVRVADLKGARAITSLSVMPGWRIARERDIRILRELSLRITWDRDATPSVWTPLGDFFGTAPGINPYRALPMGMTPEKLYSNWYMPFSKRALIEITNDGQEARRLRVHVTHRPELRAAKLLRFHAKWHRDEFAGRDAARYRTGDRWPDWPVLLADGGPGRFCGFNLHVWNPNPLGSRRKAIPGGWGDLDPKAISVLDEYVKYRAWWGEGDEKFFVDGEKYPSTFGTGSEDYFGYAFAAFNPDVFDSAFQSQPLNHNNYGHISNVRFQIADNIPFQRSFEAAIEKYHPNAWPLLYAATAYWYQAAGVADPYKAVTVDQRLNYFVEVKRDTDIYEAEQLEVARVDSGEVIFDAWFMQYSADHAIVWRNAAKPGDRLALNISVEESGNFEVLVRVGQQRDSGSYRVTLDGKAVEGEFDLSGDSAPQKVDAPAGKMFYEYSRYSASLKDITVGHSFLAKGNHVISFEAVKSGAGGTFALPIDFIRLRRVP